MPSPQMHHAPSQAMLRAPVLPGPSTEPSVSQCAALRMMMVPWSRSHARW